MKPIYFLLLLAFLVSCSGNKTKYTDVVSFIPLPNKITYEDSGYLLAEGTRNHLRTVSLDGLKLKKSINDKKRINLNLHEKSKIKLLSDYDLKSEAYILDVKSDKIEITAGDFNGFLYAHQTLLQLIDKAEKTEKGLVIPCVKIEDEPAFKWRGMHLDVCRHFFDVSFVKKMIDAMAMHKLNTFHWHLTDDQGWRIEIEKYPLLTEISAWRSESVVGHMAKYPVVYDGVKHGGFYTKKQIKEVVAYAAKRGITVVPEIEMPGHAVAALMAYPNLSCTGTPKPFNDWGVSSDVFCAGNEQTFDFIENVLAEVVELFPGEYIHVGGDECPKTKWEECSKCQKRITDEGLKDEHELQSYFIQRIEKYLNSKGKKLIGWDEILEGGLAENAAVMSWRGEEGGIKAAELDHYVVMSPGEYCYLDKYQNTYNEPLTIGGLLTMEKIYNWNPIPKELKQDKQHFILGAQGNVWTEYMPTTDRVEYMVYPRLCALAEILWTKKENQNYSDFETRMVYHYNRLDAKGIKYRIPYPDVDSYNPILKATKKIELTNSIPSSTIYYTIDGSEPDIKSIQYTEPFTLDLTKPVKLKAITVMPSGRQSKAVKGVYELCKLQASTDAENLVNGITFTKFNQAFTSAFNVAGIPSETKILKKPELPSNQANSMYGATFSGYIEVPRDGIYTFYLRVKDGGLLYINYQVVVNNDGFKYGLEKSGKIALEAGKHLFKIKYFMGKGWGELELKYQLNDGEILPVLPEQYYTTK